MPKESCVLWHIGHEYQIRPACEPWRLLYIYNDKTQNDAKEKALGKLFYLNNDRKFDNVTRTIIRHLKQIGKAGVLLSKHFVCKEIVSPYIAKER